MLILRFLTLAVLAFAWLPLSAVAQPTGKVYRIAFAHPAAPVADINQASKGPLAIPAIFEELGRLNKPSRVSQNRAAVHRRAFG